MKSILITGGTGLIGKRFFNVLDKKKFNVSILTRNRFLASEKSEYIYWDPQNEILDLSPLKNIDVIVHLAGEAIDGGRWSSAYKKKILDSRVLSTRLLYNTLKKMRNRPKVIISASAVGCYKQDTTNEQDETSSLGDNFLSDVVKQWESESKKFHTLGIKTTILRMGVVLSKDGGMLKKLYPIFRFGIGIPLGSGNQLMSWVHLDDLVNVIIHLLDGKISGVFNVVAKEKVSNKTFTKALSRTISLIALPSFFHAPSFLIKLIFGEQATLILNGLNVSSKKLEKLKYRFKFSSLDKALKNIYKK